MPHTFAVLAAQDVSPKSDKSDTGEVQHKPQSSNWIGEEPPRNSKRTDLSTRLGMATRNKQSLYMSPKHLGTNGSTIWKHLELDRCFVMLRLLQKAFNERRSLCFSTAVDCDILRVQVQIHDMMLRSSGFIQTLVLSVRRHNSRHGSPPFRPGHLSGCA